MDTQPVQQPVIATGEKLSLWTKFAFSLGELGFSVGPGTIVPFYYLFFMTDVAGLNPGLAGWALMIGKIWDAINDPIVGVISDRTRSRWGRRKPFILFGAIPFGLTFFLLWIVPPTNNQYLLTAYYALAFMLFDTAYTAVALPYGALVPEMTLDHDERTSLVTWKGGVSIVAGLLAAFVMGLILDAAPDLRTAFWQVGSVLGICFALPFFLVFAVSKEREEFRAKPALKALEGFRYVIRNSAFWKNLGIGWLSWLAISLVEAVFTYYLVHWIGMSEAASTLVLATVLGSATLFLPLVFWLSRRFEKKSAFIICTATWAFVHVGVWFVPRGEVFWAYVVAFLAGLGISSAHVLPGAMSPDVMEVDELASGHRQEGIYSGFSVLVTKLANSVALFLLGQALAWSGYVGGAETQSPRALETIRILMSPVPIALLVISMILAWLYPITRVKHAEMVSELARRRQSAVG